MKTKNFIILSILIFFSANTYAAIFKGKVINAETKQPIEGAVVVVSWSEERATPTGSTARLKDVKETLTDKNGEWVIQGPRGRDMGDISAVSTLLTGTYITNRPEFIVFKPGFCSWPTGFGIDACKQKLQPEGNDKVADGVIVELPRLTNREDRLRAQRIWPSQLGGDKASATKITNLLRLLNEERRYLGIPEDPWLKEI